MDKDYHIIAHDREILDSSMILVYDQHDEREAEAQTPPIVDRIQSHFSDGLNENQPEIVVPQTNNEDFLMDAVNAVKFKAVKNCTISVASTFEESRLKDEEKGGRDEKETVNPPSSLAPATSCSFDAPEENTNSKTQNIKKENQGGCKIDNVVDICQSHRKGNCLVIETGHEKETQGSDNQSEQNSERSLGIEDSNSTVLHVHKLEDHSEKQEEGQLYGEFIAKEDHVVLYKSHSKEAASEDQSSAAVTTTDENQAIPVCSSLQFLNTGDSIVVLTQDPSNIGLTSTISDMAIDGDRQIDLGQYELSTVPTDVNGLSMNIAESQPTFFQVELYSTGSIQTMNCQGPATVISAQQVLTVPQLFSCYWDGCNTHFLSKEDLVTHVTGQHAKPVRTQEYKCLWKGCTRDGKGFDARYKILTHLRSHTGERPHICMVEGCHKSFARLDNLKIHMRSHTGERPYRCPYEGCNKSYANSSDRFKHTRTHLEKKPYRCKFEGCDKSYTDPSSLRKHHRRHRNDGSKMVLTEAEPIVILPAVEDEGEVIDVV